MEAMDDAYIPPQMMYGIENNGEDSGIDSDPDERNLCLARAYEEATDCEYCENAVLAGYEELVETDRESPALFEVELTATEEEDDASVLELVIPTQPKRGKFQYQRLALGEEFSAENPAVNHPCWMRFACCLFAGK